jgi:hypothetical protein
MDTKSIGGLSTNRPNLDKIRVENPESAKTSKDQSKKALAGSNVSVNLSNEAMERAQAHRKAQDIALNTSHQFEKTECKSSKIVSKVEIIKSSRIRLLMA